MERKIGEIFEYNGEWYQCVRSILTCSACEIPRPCTKIRGLGYCSLNMRNDKEQVVFKKLEKVGEPHFIEDEIFEGGKVYVQNFRVYKDFEGHKPICNDYIIYDWKNRIISIEIKQNKEDMEGKKIQHYDCFFDGKSSKSNLKPFDLKAAKAGKPVCTRDGRKARIICFDRKDVRPIIALVESYNGDDEGVYYYYTDGLNLDNYPGAFDLMMLPEKKEGWMNVYKERIYSTKEEAIEATYDGVTYVDTVKISWEE